MVTIRIIDGRIWYSSIPIVTVRYTTHQIVQLQRRVPRGALIMLERSAGKLARSVLRGLGEREPTWLPGAVETDLSSHNEAKKWREPKVHSFCASVFPSLRPCKNSVVRGNRKK